MQPFETIGIEELELGVRAYNIVKRLGVHTFGDLASLTAKQVNDAAIANERIVLTGASLNQVIQAQRYCRREQDWY